MKRSTILALSIFIFAHYSFSQTKLSDEISGYIKYLASDKLEGRRAGQRGNDSAANFIAKKFKELKLDPFGDNKTYFQHFQFVDGVKTDPATAFSATVSGTVIHFTLDSAYRPLGFSADTSASSGLAFCGYGISAPQIHYDDYDGINVTGKIVVVLRYSPPTDSTNQKEFQRLSSLYRKAQVAKDKGAKGIIIVTGPLDEEVAKLMRLRYSNDEGTTSIPAISMKWDEADKLLKPSGKLLRELQSGLNVTKKPASFIVENVQLDLKVKLNKIKVTSQNVIGVLPGFNPMMSTEFLIIGAHFDHLGFGGEGSGSLEPETTAIHNGADDNASGTAGMLALARMFSEHKGQLERSIVFIAFSGEEEGLIGSAYYANHPSFPLERTVAMINMDMIGRLKNKELVVYGTGTSPLFDSLLTVTNSDSTFLLKKTKDGFGPSDQTSFYVKDIPVLFFFTNLHDDYHKPSDDWEKINFDGEAKVVQYVYTIANVLQTQPKRPLFTRVESSDNMQVVGDRRGFRASLGIIPAFGEEVQGAKISGVRPGTAAEKAGLQKDDIIIKYNGKEVLNLTDLTNFLADSKPGDKVEIVVLRGKEQVTLNAVLGVRTN